MMDIFIKWHRHSNRGWTQEWWRRGGYSYEIRHRSMSYCEHSGNIINKEEDVIREYCYWYSCRRCKWWWIEDDCEVNPIITVDTYPHLSMAPKCIYKSPPKMSSQTATSVEVMDQTDKNRKPQFIESVDNISFRMLVLISEAWKDKGMIKSWETENNIPCTCIKAQLNCKEYLKYLSLILMRNMKTCVWRRILGSTAHLLIHFWSCCIIPTTAQHNQLQCSTPIPTTSRQCTHLSLGIKEYLHPSMMLVFQNQIILRRHCFWMFTLLCWKYFTTIQGRRMTSRTKHITHILKKCGVIRWENEETTQTECEGLWE